MLIQKDSYKERSSVKNAHKDSYKERNSKPRKRDQPSTTIKTLKPSQTKVRIIHPRSGTLELWEVITWPSEDIWPAPHRCFLWGLLFLCCAGVVWVYEDRVTYCWFFGIIKEIEEKNVGVLGVFVYKYSRF